MKKLKNKRGFSLVELMVVVAIMGTLAAIAIPAYNEYRKSAKKTAYRSDLLGLHKGWLAFGVELDSFCERETQPSQATIDNVGMASLTNSSLYGTNAVVAARTASCSTGTLTPGGCTPNANTTPCTGCTGGGTLTPYRAQIPAGNGPGKHNFIGFGDDNCSTTNLSDRQILGAIGNTLTTHDAACELNTSTYDMGVYGHISGAEYFGVSVNHNGVVSGEASVSANQDQADSSC